MEQVKEAKSIRTEEEMEQIRIDVIKFLLEKNVSLEDIKHLSGKSIDEIKRIGGITD